MGEFFLFPLKRKVFLHLQSLQCISRLWMLVFASKRYSDTINKFFYMKSNKEVRFFVSFKAALAPFKPLPILLSGGSIFCCHQPTRKGLFFVWFSLSFFPARGFSIFFIYLFLLWYETLFISHVKEYSWINMFYTFWHNLSNQGIRVPSYNSIEICQDKY